MNNFKKFAALLLILSGVAVFGMVAEMGASHPHNTASNLQAVKASPLTSVAFQTIQLPEMRILSSKTKGNTKTRQSKRIQAKKDSHCFDYELVQQGSPTSPSVVVCEPVQG